MDFGSSIAFQDVRGRLTGPRLRPSRAARALALGRTVIAREVHALVTEQVWCDKFAPRASIRLGDELYYAPRLDELELLLSKSRLDRSAGLAERHESDDHAYALKGEAALYGFESDQERFGFCVGIVWGHFDWMEGYRAVNWALTADARLLLIEPQNDEIFTASRCRGDIGLLLA